MRGIVAEINRKYAIVLAQDGSFRKIRTVARMTVGSEIDVDQPSKNINATRLISKVSAVAAGVLFILGIGYGAYSYTVPYSYVDVDINPSIELTVNIYDRIIHTEALNDDGKKVLGNRDLENISLESGVSQILSTALEQGYLRASVEKKGGSTNVTTGDNTVNRTNTGLDESEPVIENAVLLTVASNNTNKSEALSRKLADLASKRLEKDSVSSEVLVGEASVAQRNDARLLGVTPGKLVLIEDALESGSELKLEDLKKASVKDLVQKAKDKKVEMEKQKAEKKLEEEKQKIEEMIASNGNNENNNSKEDNKSDKTIGNSGNPNLVEPWIEDIDRAILLERLSGQLEILERMSELNQQNNGTDAKDGNVEKGMGQRQGSGNQAAGNNTADSNGNGNSSKNSVNNSKNESKNSDNNKNKDAISKSNYNQQDIAEILEKQKKERQQLKDELLDQLFEKGTAVNGEPSENKQKGQESKENSQSGKGNKGSQGNQDSKNGKENRKK